MGNEVIYALGLGQNPRNRVHEERPVEEPVPVSPESYYCGLYMRIMSVLHAAVCLSALFLDFHGSQMKLEWNVNNPNLAWYANLFYTIFMLSGLLEAVCDENN